MWFIENISINLLQIFVIENSKFGKRLQIKSHHRIIRILWPQKMGNSF